MKKPKFTEYLIKQNLFSPDYDQFGFIIKQRNVLGSLLKTKTITLDQLYGHYKSAILKQDIAEIENVAKTGKIRGHVSHLQVAIKKNKPEAAKALIKLGYSPEELIQTEGALNSLKFLVDKAGFKPTQDTLYVAIEAQKLDVIKYIVEDTGLFPDFDNIFYGNAQRNTEAIREYFDSLHYGAPAA